MQFLEPIAHDLELLNRVNPDKVDLKLNAVNKNLEIKKKSSIPNFIRWFIYKIFCIHSPLNSDLDQATVHLVDKIKKINLEDKIFECKQKNSFKKAIENLSKVIKNNGGSRGQEVRDILETIKKIKVVEDVQKLVKQTPQEKLEEILDSTTLDGPEERLLKLSQLLENEEINFSKVQTLRFCVILTQLAPEWLLQHAQRLNPKLIGLIVQIGFTDDNYIKCTLFSEMFEALTREPVSHEHLSAFVKNLPIFKDEYRPKGNYLQRKSMQVFNFKIKFNLDSLIENFTKRLLKLNILNRQVISNMEKHLSPADFQAFLHNFFGFFANYIINQEDEDKSFDVALNLSDHLSPENRQFLLRTLCYAIPIPFLVKVFYKSFPEDNIIKTILELNPDNDEGNIFSNFFEDFINGVIQATFTKDGVLGAPHHVENQGKLRQLRPSIAQAVWNSGSEKYLEILGKKIAVLDLM